MKSYKKWVLSSLLASSVLIHPTVLAEMVHVEPEAVTVDSFREKVDAVKTDEEKENETQKQKELVSTERTESNLESEVDISESVPTESVMSVPEPVPTQAISEPVVTTLSHKAEESVPDRSNVEPEPKGRLIPLGRLVKLTDVSHEEPVKGMVKQMEILPVTGDSHAEVALFLGLVLSFGLLISGIVKSIKLGWWD